MWRNIVMDGRNFNRIRYSLITCLFLVGSGSSILTITLNLNNFYYPLFQLVIMFLAEFFSISLIIYRYFKPLTINNSVSNFLIQDSKPAFFSRSGKSIYSLLSLLDLITTSIEHYCLFKMLPSDFLTLKMTVNYYIILYRIIFLKSRIFKHQWLGLLIFTIGFLLIAISNIIISTNSERSLYGIYIALMLFAELVSAINILASEYYLWKNDATSAEVNTIKGITGLLTCFILYPLIFINALPRYYFELETPFTKLFSQTLGILTIFLIIDLAIYNFIYYYYLKLSDSLAVYSADSGRIVIVGIILAFINKKNNDKLIAVQIIGGVFIFMGLFVYNEILIVPLFGFDKSARESLDTHKFMKQERAKNRAWIHKLDELVEIENKNKE